MNQATIEIETQRDIIRARQAGREFAQRLGFGMADQTRLATAISELTRNAIIYAGGGVCSIADVSTELQNRILVEVIDEGPGIADIDKAMTYGYTTGKGLGAGLPGARSLMHHFEVESRPGHTRVAIQLIRKKR